MKKHMGTRILFGSAVTLLAGALAMAQQMPGGMQQNPPGQAPQAPGQQPTTPNYPNNSSTMGQPGVPGSQGSSIRSFADRAFLTRTLAGSAAEAKMSQLAQQKSPSKDVKSFGTSMVQIHRQLEKQLQPIATMLGVKVGQKPTKKEKKQIAKLEALSGPAFDQAYIKAMARDQQHDVKLFKDEETAAQTPAIKQAARLDMPVFSQHLHVLDEIAQNHDVTIAKR